MKALYLLFLGILLSFCSFSQTISGVSSLHKKAPINNPRNAPIVYDNTYIKINEKGVQVGSEFYPYITPLKLISETSTTTLYHCELEDATDPSIYWEITFAVHHSDITYPYVITFFGEREFIAFFFKHLDVR